MPLSYRMERGPGIKDGFTREKRGRVSLHLVVMLRWGGKEVYVQEARVAWGTGRRKRERGEAGGGVGEGSDGGKERLCSVKERGTRSKL